MITYRLRGSARFLAAALMFLPVIVLAQKPVGLPGNYPSKPVKVIIGAPAGGGADLVARMITVRISEVWGSQFVLENITSGIGGVIALQNLQKAAPDGYTLGNFSLSEYSNAAFSRNVGFDVRKSFQPIVQTIISPFYMVFSMKAPFSNLKEMIAYAKNNPGVVTYAHGGVGGASHLIAEQIAILGGFKWTGIPYKGASESVTDAAAGRIMVALGSTNAMAPSVKSGALRGIGVTTAKRLALQPDLPTLAELGLPGLDWQGCVGWLGPAGIPEPIVRAVNSQVNKILEEPQTRKALIAASANPVGSTPEEFGKALNDGLDLVQSILTKTGIKLAE